jgi:hypothetical protein
MSAASGPALEPGLLRVLHLVRSGRFAKGWIRHCGGVGGGRIRI